MRRALGGALVVLALGACNAILGNEERTLYEADASVTGGAGGAGGAPSGGTGGVGATGGSSGGAGTDASIDASGDAEADAPLIVDCDAGVSDDASVAVCPGNVMYVSVDGGDDSNSGCSPCFPKATLGGALSSLRAATALDAGGSPLPAGFAVKACKGLYSDTSLLLDLPVSLYGGYDCATWTRTGSQGWPTFDKVNETTIRNGDVSKQVDSLRVSGSAVDASVTIEGFTILGWPAGAPAARSKALGVYGGAAPRITGNLIQGGASKGSGSGGGLDNVASTGLWIEQASPDVTQNQIHGGSGSVADYGSVGVLVRGASSKPKLQGNEIHGGSGSGQDDGSIGLRVFENASMTEAGGNPIADNVIWSGTGVDDSLFGISAGGVVLHTPAELVGNSIRGETLPNNGSRGCGVRVFGAGVVARNRIYSGDATSTSGVWAQGNGARIENNMIHSGHGHPALHGVWIQGSGVQLLHNTIVSHTPGNNQLVEQVYLESGTGAVIRGNIFMAQVSAVSTGIRSKVCLANNAIATLHDNVFLNNDTLAEFQVSGCAGAATVMTQLQSPINNAGGSASGNLYYKGAGGCGGLPTGCVELEACSGAATKTLECFHQLFTGWTGDGTSELFTTGWRLKPSSVPCPIARGPTHKSVTHDLFDAARTEELSRGAHEHDGPCF
ncbi:MAG: hypothetical protein KF718_27095 [Polyangiaceae bacterium]|nr:hypothetical protein [Polyangiaceae bacterium]